MEETELCHLLVLRSRPAVVGVWMDADASPWNEQTCYFNIFRFHEADKVFHDDVDTVLMETAMIAETEKIEFEAFALYHTFVGKIADAYLCEVRLTGNGAERRELGTVEAYPVVVLGMLVLERLQHFRSIFMWNFGFLAKGFQAFFFSIRHDNYKL